MDLGTDGRVSLFPFKTKEQRYLKKTLNHKILISSVLPIAPSEMEGHLADLRALVIDRVGVTGEEVEQALEHIVPSFKRYVPPCIKVEQTQDDTAEEKKS